MGRGEEGASSAPANNALVNNIALAVVRHRGFRFAPEAADHFSMRREDAFDAVRRTVVARISRRAPAQLAKAALPAMSQS